MPEYGPNDFDRHGCGRVKLQLDTGVLQPDFLSDLPDRSPMVRQRSLGL
jgi:hypothetical protein